MSDGRSVIAQAFDMIDAGDLCKWTEAHSRVTLSALREFQATWGDAQPSLPALVMCPACFAECKPDERWPAGLLDRIKAAERRIEDNRAPRSIPADPHSDVDLVLAEVRYLIEGRWPPFWITGEKQ